MIYVEESDDLLNSQIVKSKPKRRDQSENKTYTKWPAA